jgi:hypothetical protein
VKFDQVIVSLKHVLTVLDIDAAIGTSKDSALFAYFANLSSVKNRNLILYTLVMVMLCINFCFLRVKFYPYLKDFCHVRSGQVRFYTDNFCLCRACFDEETS